VPLGVAELLEDRSQVSARTTFEVDPRRLEQPALDRHHRAVIDDVCRKCGRLAVIGTQQLVLDQHVRTDQQVVARE
jgi:hypothetical protein